jgi:hypothetical protein
MTTQSLVFFIIGALVLWGGLAVTLIIAYKNRSND